MTGPGEPTPTQLRRLVEELSEAGLDLDGSEPWHELAIVETAYALRPRAHERRIPSYGAVIEPSSDPATWEAATLLQVQRRPVGDSSVASTRRYADGMVSWLIRRIDGNDEWIVLDRPAGSERDLVVLSTALDGVVVQRHPAGFVRIVGQFGVLRWAGLGWHHEPLVANWVQTLPVAVDDDRRALFQRTLEFAVHDLGARGIGATLVVRPDPTRNGVVEPRLGVPPPLQIDNPLDLAPLRHALAQLDGAALFDETGVLRQIGVHLGSTPEASLEVDGFRGTRHTSARRYSYDDPGALVIVVSEDGPVTVFSAGEPVALAMGADGARPLAGEAVDS